MLSVGQDHSVMRAAPASPTGLRVESAAKLARCLDAAQVSCGGFVTHSVALRIDCGLREDTTHFGFSGVSRFAFLTALAPLGLLGHHRYPRAVQFHVQVGDRGASGHWQFQLYGLLDLGLLARGNVGADGFGHSFYGFGGHHQPSQQEHLFGSQAKRRALAADHPQHAPHAGRELGPLYVQCLVGGELSLMATGTQIVGAEHPGRADRGEHLLGPQLLIVRRAAAGAGEISLRRRFLGQQLGQTGRPSLMHGGANRHLHSLQIQTTGPASLREDPLQ